VPLFDWSRSLRSFVNLFDHKTLVLKTFARNGSVASMSNPSQPGSNRRSSMASQSIGSHNQGGSRDSFSPGSIPGVSRVPSMQMHDLHHMQQMQFQQQQQQMQRAMMEQQMNYDLVQERILNLHASHSHVMSNESCHMSHII